MHHTEDDKTTGIYIRKVLEYIQINLEGDVSLQRLADVAHYSPFHFQRMFSHFVGETLKQYIIRLRLERIAHYLRVFPDVPVSDLADRSGFTSLSTFSRAFKNFFGVSAIEYRQLSNEQYRNLGKTNSKNCKTSLINTNDLCIRDFSMDEIMDWNEKVIISTKRVQGFDLMYQSTCLDTSDAISLAYRKLCQWAAPRGLLTAETRFVGMLLDIPFITSIEKCRYWAGITVPAMEKLPREASLTKVPDGFYASYAFQGNLFSTVKSLAFFSHGWIPESGYAIKEIVGYEIYAENPAHKPSETIEREILIPIRPA